MEQNLALFSSLSAEIDEDVSYEVDSEASLFSPHHSTSPKKNWPKKKDYLNQDYISTMKALFIILYHHYFHYFHYFY